MAIGQERRVLAQVTESRMAAPLAAPLMAGFATVFSTVSRAAREAEGFCWQLEAATDGHPVAHPDDPLRVVTLSTWRDYGCLHAFVYRSMHGRALLHRAAWFTPVAQPSTALWWVPAARPPTLDAAIARLTFLRVHGPTPRAFSLRRRFDPDGRPALRRPAGPR